MRVFVYWNLHAGLWSVKALEGPKRGLVIARLPEVYLSSPVGKVSEAGRQRVLKEQRKNVHAGIVGDLWHPPRTPTGDTEEVTYNPYKYDSFVYKATEAPLQEGHRWARLSTTPENRGRVRVNRESWLPGPS